MTNRQKEIDEYAVKAAQICNFTKFIDWPHELKKDEFVICTNDKKKAYPYLIGVTKGRSIHKKKVVVKLCSLTDMKPCDLLFIHKDTEEKDVQKYARNSAYENTLIVTEHKNGLKLGAIINFVELQNRVKFEYNLRTANDKSFKTSSQLLKIAVNVVVE